MHRFYHPGSLEAEEFELTGDEAHHLTRVLRLTVGNRVELFDGRGVAVEVDIAGTNKRAVELRAVGSQIASPPRRPMITLLTAAPKSDRLRWLVEKATELDVSTLSLIQTQHSIVHPGSGKLDKLNSAVIAACKQSGRNDLMQIDAPRPWTANLQELTETQTPVLIAVPGSRSLGNCLQTIQPLESVAVAIGPEGGWTAEELSLAESQGAIRVGLGPNVMRTETAALATVSAIRMLDCDIG